MRQYIQYPLIFIFLLSANISKGQALPKVWDLNTCLQYAKENNITINSLKLSSKTAEQNLIAAQAAQLPNLGASVSQGLANYKTGLQNSSNYGVNSDLTLYNGGYLKNDIKSKELGIQTANLSVAAAQNDITIQITQAYLNILLAKENIAYLQDLLTTSLAQVTQAQQQLNAGTIAKKDLLQLQATTANDKYTLITAQNNLQQNTLTLKQILQLDTSVPFEVSPIDIVKTTQALENLAIAQEKALNSRPEIKSAQLSVEIGQIEIEKARSGIRPTLSLGGSLYSAYNTNAVGNYTNQLNNTFNQALGLTLAIPIFDRKITRTNTAKANINLEQAKLSLLDVKTTLGQNVERAYINVQNANSQYEAANEQFNYTSEALRIAEQQLKIGVNNTVEYLQQKTLYVQALQAFIQAKYTATLYTKIYNFYTGIPITN